MNNNRLSQRAILKLLSTCKTDDSLRRLFLRQFEINDNAWTTKDTSYGLEFLFVENETKKNFWIENISRYYYLYAFATLCKWGEIFPVDETIKKRYVNFRNENKEYIKENIEQFCDDNTIPPSVVSDISYYIDCFNWTVFESIPKFATSTNYNKYCDLLENSIKDRSSKDIANYLYGFLGFCKEADLKDRQSQCLNILVQSLFGVEKTSKQAELVNRIKLLPHNKPGFERLYNGIIDDLKNWEKIDFLAPSDPFRDIIELPLTSEVTAEDEKDYFIEAGLKYSFDGRKLLKATDKCLDKVVIRDGTLVICDQAFRGCMSSEIVMPESLTHIGKRAFYESAINSIIIPDNVKVVGDEAFGDCAELKKIRFGRRIEHIRIDFFRTYYSNIYISQRTLKELVISGVTEIDDKTFESFHALESVVFEEGVTKIGNHAFSFCSNIKSIDIPNSVKEIGCYAFWGCHEVKSITIGSGLKSIASGTFDGCGIDQIVIPDQIIEIGYGSFSSCKNLHSIQIGKSLKTIGNSAFSDTRIERINIPTNVVEISSYAFKNCYYLNHVEIISNNIKICECAFENCRSLSEDCKAKLIERFGPFIFQLSTASKIKGFFGDLWDALTDSSYKNPLFP